MRPQDIEIKPDGFARRRTRWALVLCGLMALVFILGLFQTILGRMVG